MSHDWESRYQAGEDLPWDEGVPAAELEDFFRSPPEGFQPSSALEVGCGTGTNAVWLATQAQTIKVTATEIAPSALQAAKARADKAGVKIDYRLLDICAEPPQDLTSQDFAFDRGVFHVIPAQSRAAFVKNLAACLKPGAYWLSLAGNKDEPRENPEVGPPQLTAVELLEHIEPLFELIKLERSRFQIPDGSAFLAWKALYKKRS
ncbi:MAG: class I SAM-dependent methyltransferase [Cyanobacteria bacterium SZAS LIN-2]|nr:class I SAM-dependent methyltransferase [Cyanobacteria bacterium SZAS LIN-2]